MHNYKDLRRQRFGHLIAIKPTEKRINRRIVWECRCDCGKKTFVSSSLLISGSTRSCGCLHKKIIAAIGRRDKKREKNPHWKGGLARDGNGRMKILMPEHPAAQTSGYVPEHRIIMEQKIGRLLKLTEVVHHIDGNRSNNDPSNLMLFSSTAEHTAYHAAMKKKITADVP